MPSQQLHRTEQCGSGHDAAPQHVHSALSSGRVAQVTTVLSVAPILQLPLEIFLLIFVFFYEDCGGYNEDSRTPPQLSVSQVCASWRAALHGTPRLWSSLYLRIPGCSNPRFRDPRTLEKRRTVIEGWLSRSGTLPFTIHFTDHSEDGDADVRTLFAFVTPFLSRCTELKVASIAIVLPAILHLPSVQSLSLVLTASRAIDIPSVLPSTSGTAQLKNLQIDSATLQVWMQNLAQDCALSISSVTSLEIVGFAWNPWTYVAAIAACETLEVCRIVMPDLFLLHPSMFCDREISSRPSSLTTLSIVLGSAAGIGTLIDVLWLLNLPYLATLSIEVDSGIINSEATSIGWQMLDIFKALDQSGSVHDLQRLELRRVHAMSCSSLESVLVMFPTIIYVGIYDCDFVGHMELGAVLKQWSQEDKVANGQEARSTKSYMYNFFPPADCTPRTLNLDWHSMDFP